MAGINGAAASAAVVRWLAPGRGTQRQIWRKRLFGGLGGGVVALGGTGYAYNATTAAHYVETDDAYVGANSAVITPLYGGP
ncbi:MAG TPA: hypothetical protein VEQ16_03865, partial [Acidocella sp.]|nr:hypothetical protein [Acidocella sp.]